MESASSARGWGSKARRGWQGLGAMSSTGRKSTCVSNISAHLLMIGRSCPFWDHFSADRWEETRENRREIKKSTENPVLFS